MIWRTIGVLCLMCLSTLSYGQRFHFGVDAAVVASQVDGDELSGFNKIGYQAGLVGGYSFSDAHWLVLELQYAEFGSRRRNEDIEMNLEMDLGSINVLAAYSLRFGDSWDGIRKFRVLVGPKFQRLLKVEGPNVNESTLQRSFVSAHVGLSYVISESLLIDLSYTHAFGNLLLEPLRSTDSLVPYYLALGLNYYIFK